MDPFLSMLGELRDALYPQRCLLCGCAAEGRACTRHGLPSGPVGPRCGRCADELPPALADGARCRTCRARAPGFRGVLALGDYRGSEGLREWVLAGKHGGRRDALAELGRRLGLRLARDPRGARWRRVLVPVPLHVARRFERGYDQAALLARAAAAAARLPVIEALRRTRATPAQGAPGARSRRANVRGAFALRRGARALAGADVWLVDDVLTSGATAGACASVLR
ncbi:MAG: ComF family protein, partial [Planctomycetota bacterium]